MTKRAKHRANGVHDHHQSLPAGKHQEGDARPAQPSSNEQSGSAGRRSDLTDASRGQDTGQGRYGQSGLGGRQHRETDGQARYRRSGPEGGALPDPDSNPGSGSADREAEDPGQTKKP